MKRPDIEEIAIKYSRKFDKSKTILDLVQYIYWLETARQIVKDVEDIPAFACPLGKGED